MLKLLRKKKVAKRIYYGLAFLIIPAFVVWGSASVMRRTKSGADYAGIIFGKKVNFEEFRDATMAWQTQMKLQYGEKAREVIAAMPDSTEQVWDRMILLYEANRRKIRVSDNEVIETLTRMPFLERNGRFDPQTYQLFLNYSLGVPARLFEEQLRQSISMGKLYAFVTANVSVTDEEVKREYTKLNEQTRVKYVAFLPVNFKDQATATDEEVRAYYDQNKEKFEIPPQVSAAYIAIPVKEGLPEEEKTEIQKKVKSALETARTGGLEKAAEETGAEIRQTGLFGPEDPIPTLGWMPQLAAMLFDLSKDEISKGIEYKNNYYIFKVIEKTEATIPEFKDVQEKVKTTVLTQKVKDIASKKAEEFLEKVKASPAAFEQTAKDDGLEVKETALFTRDDYIPEIGMGDALKEAAFALKVDEVAGKLVSLEQGFYVIKSAETAPFDPEEYKREKDAFGQQYLENKKNEVFSKFANQLKTEAGLINHMKDEQK